MNKFFKTILCLLILTAMTQATTWHVPQNFATIQEAIMAAVDGDTVLVAEDTYYENINFKGKAITVASHFILDQDTSHISKTIINGSQPSDPDSGSVVFFEGGTDTTSILKGFTVTGGTGTVFIRPNLPPLRYGGGVYVYDYDGARIEWNRIEQNSIDTEYDAGGAGISSGGPGSPGYTIIAHNVIQKNEVNGAAGTKQGCAIWMGNNGRIEHNVIFDNSSMANSGTAIGAIRLISGFDFPLSSVDVLSNTITFNMAQSEQDWAAAGGLNSSGTVVNLFNNRIENNWVQSPTECFAAGVHVALQPESSRFENNIISFNHFMGSEISEGGGLFLVGSKSQIINNTIVHNEAAYGGAIALSSNSDLNFINTIIYGNTALNGGDQIWLTDDASDPDFSYCDIEDGLFSFGFETAGHTYSGSYEHNMDADPMFADTLFHLSESSPCIDAGNPDPAYNDPEDPGNTGYALFPAQGTIRSDMGATGGALVTAIEGQPLNRAACPRDFVLHQNYPNPFNPKTVISYQLPVPSSVELSIYNILGQKVVNLVSGKQKAGRHEVHWDASGFASGIYLYKLSADQGYTKTKKLVLLK